MKINSGSDLDWKSVEIAAKDIINAAESGVFCPPEAIDIHLIHINDVYVAIDSIIKALNPQLKDVWRTLVKTRFSHAIVQNPYEQRYRALIKLLRVFVEGKDNTREFLEFISTAEQYKDLDIPTYDEIVDLYKTIEGKES